MVVLGVFWNCWGRNDEVGLGLVCGVEEDIIWGFLFWVLVFWYDGSIDNL